VSAYHEVVWDRVSGDVFHDHREGFRASGKPAAHIISSRLSRVTFPHTGPGQNTAPRSLLADATAPPRSFPPNGATNGAP